ncbi:MAG: hypothetical protein Q8J69_03690 [Sphingobacteriaceae bacterium]|nr:hypothetical protein [Sphingobacteriaceae bacterium]
MQQNNCDLGVASEGSFGPHPSLTFVNADDEFILFIDAQKGLEIIARTLSTSTNFNAQYVQNQEELLAFAQASGFPQHGLILRKSKDENTDIYKGITAFESLVQTFELLQYKYNRVYAETDMRAMYNPTRMSVIEKTTLQLVEKIQSVCPQCKTPGFGITTVVKGLPCSLCGAPTNSTLSCIYTCQACGHREEALYPHQKTAEDPMYCDHCNP